MPISKKCKTTSLPLRISHTRTPLRFSNSQCSSSQSISSTQHHHQLALWPHRSPEVDTFSLPPQPRTCSRGQQSGHARRVGFLTFWFESLRFPSRFILFEFDPLCFSQSHTLTQTLSSWRVLYFSHSPSSPSQSIRDTKLRSRPVHRPHWSLEVYAFAMLP